MAERLAAGEPLDEVCWNFLALDAAARCFLLDAHGRQSGRNVVLRADRALAEARFSPLADAQGANWLRRPYFRSAIAEPGRVQVTRPYLSINEAQPCVTLSVAVRIGDAQRVLWRYRLARRRSGRRLAPRASRAARWRPSRGSARMRELS